MVQSLRSPRTLQAALYSGIALIVVSMLFLNQEFSASSFLIQASLTLAAPAFFYVVGYLVMRYLAAPLAGPGIVATGAWLVVVSLIHLYDQRLLLPESWQPYYWLVASLIAVSIVTRTGHRVPIWLIAPLVPLLQINAFWTVLDAMGVSVEWWAPITFELVVAWWELRPKHERWQRIYRVSATLLTICLIVMSYTLKASTPQTIVATWVAGAIAVMFLGVRQGWVNFGPLAIGMLFCATLWGIEPMWWSPAWLALATIIILLMEQQALRHREDSNISIEISVALAVLLSGGAALYSVLGAEAALMSPLLRALVLLEAGVLLAWLGWRREFGIAAHVGLWLIAAAWTQVYLVWFAETQVFGVWIGLLAAVALLTERLMSSMQKQKHKRLTLLSTVMRLPLADLALGLTLFMVLWTFWNVGVTSPLLIAVTTGVTVGIWIIAGLVYRLPPLLHIALWLAPLPWALLLMYLLPPLRQLPLVGLSWQMLGLGYVLIGHSLYRQRPAVVLPFFIAGYGLLNLPLLLTLYDPNLLPLSLVLPMLVSLVTAVIVMLDKHPAWTDLVSQIINPNDRPYAYDSLHNFFLLHGSWTAVVWIHLLLGYSGLSFAQQGIVLVLFSGAFVTIGRLLPRVGGVGWHVYSAGWLMWLAGLAYVYTFPTEALITIILGLIISVEAVYRSREVYWLPVLILQLLFTVLQLTHLLVLPTELILLAITVIVTISGLFFHQDVKGRLAAICGLTLIGAAWLLHHDLATTVSAGIGLVALALSYQQWALIIPVQGLLAIEMLNERVGWEWWLAAGIIQLASGTALMGVLRPRRNITYLRAIRDYYDYATPFLWGGFASTVYGWFLLVLQGQYGIPYLLTVMVILTGVMVVLMTVTGLRNAPYLATGLAGITLAMLLIQPGSKSYFMLKDVLPLWSLGLVLAALTLHVALRWCASQRRPFARMRRLVWWLKPLWQLQNYIGLLSVIVLMLIYSGYRQAVLLPTLTGGLLVVWCGLNFQRNRKPVWLWSAVTIAAITWVYLLKGLAVDDTYVLYTLPLAVGLFALAWFADAHHGIWLEYAGVGSMGLGMMLDLKFDASPLTLLLCGGQVMGLVFYGYVARRRVPFTGGVVMLLAGGAVGLIKISFWFVPLLIGVGLMIVAVGLEVARETLERWLVWWESRWQE